MARKDTVAAEICKTTGMQAAMELFFLLRRTYPPYYKWTFRALESLDTNGRFARLIKDLSETNCSLSAWEYIRYMPDNLNMSDRIVVLSEQIAEMLVVMLAEKNLITGQNIYLEKYVDEVLGYENRQV